MRRVESFVGKRDRRRLGEEVGEGVISVGDLVGEKVAFPSGKKWRLINFSFPSFIPD